MGGGGIAAKTVIGASGRGTPPAGIAAGRAPKGGGGKKSRRSEGEFQISHFKFEIAGGAPFAAAIAGALRDAAAVVSGNGVPTGGPARIFSPRTRGVMVGFEPVGRSALPPALPHP